MSSLKKNYMKRDFVTGVYLSEAPSPPMTPYPPHSVYAYTVYLFTQGTGDGGGGGGKKPLRSL
jgi:hypothetical protein